LRLFQNNYVKEKNFNWVKKNLDPAESYIVFENNIKEKTGSLFSITNPVFTYLNDNKILWEQVLDKDLLREYLVIQIEPGTEDEMLGKLIEYKFSKNIVYYLYKSQQY
jgi:hypothetical protein